MRIGFDIDGVLADFETGLYERLKETGHVMPPRAQLSNNFFWEAQVPAAKSEIHTLFGPNQNDFWENLPAVDEGADFDVISEYIKSKKDDVYFVTSRPNHLLKPTKKWLGQNLDLDNVHIVMGTVSKASICRGLGLATYIDDRFLYAYEVAHCSQTRSYMLSNSANFYFGDVSESLVNRVGSVVEYIREVG